MNQAYAVDENGTLTVHSPGVLSNISPVGTPLTAELVSGPANGSLSLNADGSFTYTPATCFYGNDSFTYTADAGTDQSNVATATLSVDQQGVVVNTNDSGPGSLRQAILDSNANPVLAVITFDIPGSGVQTINVGSTTGQALPFITNPVFIDGESQPGYSGSPLIVINGSQAGSARGLVVTSDDTTLRGLVINGFAGTGVYLAGNGDVLEDSYIGTSADGTQADGNSTGVAVGGASGGTISDDLISANGANDGAGINVDSSTNITIQGNKIGTDVTGNTAFTLVHNNDSDIRASNDSNLNILDNVISGGAYFGISLSSNNDHVAIQGNRIGTQTPREPPLSATPTTST